VTQPRHCWALSLFSPKQMEKNTDPAIKKITSHHLLSRIVKRFLILREYWEKKK